MPFVFAFFTGPLPWLVLAAVTARASAAASRSCSDAGNDGSSAGK